MFADAGASLVGVWRVHPAHDFDLRRYSGGQSEFPQRSWVRKHAAIAVELKGHVPETHVP